MVLQLISVCFLVFVSLKGEWEPRSLAAVWSCHISVLKRHSTRDLKQSLAFYSLLPRALRMNQVNALFRAKWVTDLSNLTAFQPPEWEGSSSSRSRSNSSNNSTSNSPRWSTTEETWSLVHPGSPVSSCTVHGPETWTKLPACPIKSSVSPQKQSR